MTKHIEGNNGDKPNPIANFVSIFRNNRQVLALVLAGSLMMGHFFIIPFINPYMEFNVGFTKNQTQFIYMVGGIATLISAPLSGRLADKMGKLKLFTIAAIISLPPIFLITNMPAIPFYYVLVVTGLWFVVANARSVTSSAMISGVVPPETRGSFMSLNSSIQQMFTGIAALIAGFIIVTDKATQKISHYPWVGYLSLLVIVICIFLGRKLGEGKE